MEARSNSLYAVCIARAAQRLGGYEALALRVGVSASVLKYWARGNGTGAHRVFLKIVDILSEPHGARASPPAGAPAADPRT